MKDFKTLQVNNLQIRTKSYLNNQDYISLTDMAKFKSYDSGIVISNWLSLKYTVKYLGLWEEINNHNFNLIEFNKIKNEAGSHGFIISSSYWIKNTNAIGIKSSAGRYGGTYAHKDIAFEFASWLSPEFKLYLIKEFQRLKVLENTSIKSLEWQVRRIISKTNYHLQTEAIKKQLEKLNLLNFQDSLIYASEADILNLIVFGKTAKQWQEENKRLAKQGLNIRDTANVSCLIVLSNLETLNAYLLNNDKDKKERIGILTNEVKNNFEVLAKNNPTKKLKIVGRIK